ncbi:MAG TPA: enoyl-CoA hydratase-related protein [Sphingomonadales bacterium]|nr:enoyl-CoA hydratase-related protein [Sphingomonadales bacterium]
MMGYANLLCEVDASVALVTVNRPEKLNPLSGETLEALDACFADLSSDGAVGAIILTGAGDKAFVAGGDISEFASLTGVTGQEKSLRGQKVFNRIENLGKPVIAAINGYALGGGLELAMACHLRIASENAVLGQPEVKLGVLPGFGGSQRLPRLIGKGRATEMILTGAPVSAQEAFRIGLVNRVTPQGELIRAARELAATILKNAPIAVELSLRAIQHGMEMPLSAALAWEAAQFGLCCGTEDFQEGARAFLEKRKAEFKGR